MEIIELKLLSILGANYPKLFRIIILCLNEENSLVDIVLSSLLTLDFPIIKQNILFLRIPYLIYLLLFPFRLLFFLQNIEIVESFGNIKDFAYHFQISITIVAELKRNRYLIIINIMIKHTKYITREI